MKKAKFIGTRYEKGIKYGIYEYLGETYEVCLNAFYSFQSIATQHKREQAFIENRQSAKPCTGTEPAAYDPAAENAFKETLEFFEGK